MTITIVQYTRNSSYNVRYYIILLIDLNTIYFQFKFYTLFIQFIFPLLSTQPFS